MIALNISKKSFFLIFVGVVMLLSIVCLVYFGVWQKTAKNIPISITFTSDNPLLKDVSLDKKTVNDTLKKYQYFYSKKSTLFSKNYASTFQRINIHIVTTPQKRFARYTGDNLYAASGTILLGYQLDINLYLSDSFIQYWLDHKDLSTPQKILNQQLILELFTNSPYYTRFTTHSSGIPLVESLVNAKPETLIIINEKK